MVDVIQIRIGKHLLGIIGLETALVIAREQFNHVPVDHDGVAGPGNPLRGQGCRICAAQGKNQNLHTASRRTGELNKIRKAKT